MVTDASRKQYKQQVIKAVSEQLLEPINDIYKQAQLTREEKRKREAAERRVEEVERREKEWAEKYLAEQRENIEFHQLTREYAAALEKERTERSALSQENAALGKTATRLNERLEISNNRVRDIPLVEVMRELGYRGEGNGKGVVYQDAQGRAALTVTDNKVTRGSDVVARNAVDLVIHVREVHERKPTTPHDTIGWLAERFGNDRAVAATLVRAEQQATTIIREHERSHEVQMQREQPQREMQREQRDGRGGFTR